MRLVLLLVVGWALLLIAVPPAFGAHCAVGPGTPADLQATETGATSIGLTWTASSGTALVDYYEVWRSQNGSWAVISTAASTSPTYTDTTVTAGQLPQYLYKVRAVGTAGQVSAYSNIASTDTSPPTAPASLTATTVSNAQINLSWTASTDNASVTGYRIERCQGGGCQTFAQIDSVGTATTYSNTGLTPGFSYSYRVRAEDAAGYLSDYSPVATGVTTTELLNIQTTGVLNVQNGGLPDDVFYLQAPNGTTWRITASGTTGSVMSVEGLSGSPIGRALTAPNGKVWDFAITSDGILIVTERP